MPVHAGKDSKGCYCQWGDQKKYYYECGNKKAKGRAWAKAAAQGKKIESTGWTENSGENRMFQYVTTNIKPKVRNDSMEGRDWLVCPTIMINEGVHNGSDGPILYPADELGKLPVTWNHKPVVVYHPYKNGMTVSACDPVELTTRKVGVLMNTSFGDTEHGPGLKSEAWLEPSRIEAVDSRIGEAIENNEMMEVSTGLYMDLDKTEGEWNGEKYVGIARNLQPDHLALLPDLKGACSIEDGAGFLRVNEENGDVAIIENGVDVTEKYIRIRQKDPGLFKDDSMKTVWLSKTKGINSIQGKLKSPPKGHEGSMVLQSYLFVKEKWTKESAKKWVKEHKGTTSAWELILNEMGHESIRRLLNSQLREKDENAWIEEVYDTFFIFENDGKLFRQAYSTDGGKVTITGQAEEVVKVTEYRKADGSFVGNVTNAEWTTKYINDLPDSAFLYVSPGGKKDSGGRTTPRSLRHFPFKDKNGKVDMPHLRNALARIPQSNVPADVKKRCTARAKSILKKSKLKSNWLFKKGAKMDKEQMVNVLIESEKTQWTEDDRDELTSLSETMLTNMTELIKEPVKNEEDDKSKKAGDGQETQTETTAATTNEKKPQTVEEYLANADIPKGIREVLQAGVDTVKSEKDRLISIITANKRNVFTKENLETKQIEELKALARLATTEDTEVNSPIKLYDYTGQGETPNVSQKQIEVTALPTIDDLVKKTG